METKLQNSLPAPFVKLRPRRVLGVALIAFIAITAATIAAMPRRVSRRLTHMWLVVSGKLVDVGGHRLHIECRGSGSPTVILESGLNMTMNSWGGVPRDTAAFTRVCAYDRAGLDFSERGPEPRTSRRIAEELHTLLNRSGVEGPFVLVGHSFGALNVRVYSGLYPTEVSGVVLVDPSYEEQYERFAALKDPPEREKYLQHESGGNYEGVNLLTSAMQVKEAPAPPAVPVVILYPQRNANEDHRVAAVIAELQAQLARRLPQSKQIFVANSSHFIQLDRPELLMDSIKEVVNAARSQRSSL